MCPQVRNKETLSQLNFGRRCPLSPSKRGVGEGLIHDLHCYETLNNKTTWK